MGVEISPIAVSSFFQENRLEPERVRLERFERWESEGVSIYLGDFFDLTTNDLADIKGVYDRASLIAMPPDMRERYAKHLISILPISVPVLLVTIEYDQSEMEGPPFSVTENEVCALYGGRRRVLSLFEREVLAENPQFASKGVSWMKEKVFKLA
jgi:thiopurine S-methyltransferase